MQTHLKLFFTFLVVFLVSCASHSPDTSMQGISVIYVPKDKIADNSTARPVMTINKENSDLFLSAWTPSSRGIVNQSQLTQSLQNGTLKAVGIWSLLNNRNCAEISLQMIKPQPLGKSTLLTVNQGRVEINSIQYSELWTVNSCDKMQNWQIADDDGKHTMYPLQ